MNTERILKHEIGHAFIAYLFHNDYYIFEGVVINPEDKFNKNDLAYTISTPVGNFIEKINQDRHLAAAIDGLLLLGGIAGMTVFQNDNHDKLNIDATLLNYESYFDFEGSEGDFEIINRANRPYGWYLFKAGQMTQEQAQIRHLRLLNFLKSMFLENIFQESFAILKQRCIDNNKLTIDDFDEIFNCKVAKTKKETIKLYIKSGQNKPILVE